MIQALKRNADGVENQTQCEERQNICEMDEMCGERCDENEDDGTGNGECEQHPDSFAHINPESLDLLASDGLAEEGES